MNEYLIYYNEIPINRLGPNPSSEEIEKADIPYIWYYLTKANNIFEALQSFVGYGAKEDQIIQIIVKNKLH